MNLPEAQLWDAMCSEWGHLIDVSESRINHCLEQLTEAQVWQKPFDTGNSIANQILHVSGNLRQWAVNGVLQRLDDRNRESEFAAVDSCRVNELQAMLKSTLDDVRSTLPQITAAQLLEPRIIQGFKVTVLGALCHTIPHLVGHAHQITLTTRLLLGDSYRFHWSPASDRTTVPL